LHGDTGSDAAGRQAFDKRTRSERSRPTTSSPDASDTLRQELLAELEQLEDPETLANWAQRALPLKNQLSTPDAQVVDDAFAAKLSRFGELEPAAATPDKANGDGKRPLQHDPKLRTVTVIGKPVRERNRQHLKLVVSLPCLVCGRTPSDAHHIKFAEQRAMGRKVSDRFTVPVCRLHHRELHRQGNERAWWQSQGIDPLDIAATLWAKTNPLEPAEIDIAGDTDLLPSPIWAQLNERHFANGASSPTGGKVRGQNDQTKPNTGRGAE
jgi:hypothetical protein